MAGVAGMGAAICPWAALQLAGLVRFFTHPTEQPILAAADVQQTEKFML